ncbi:MAG TPA: ABC-type transport auxiliary lipoprotein family protein [Rhodocyclaceae bacterium]|nr:ABC-type transport auxiliary lipoprotein family protein [Rhodocyclaceae bacterium]
MRIVPLVLLLLSGCAVVRQPPADYDLGPPEAGAPPAVALSRIAVNSPSWLMTPLMQYRLSYLSGTRREAYADSRWAAPPAELVALALQRRLLGDGTPVPGCRLAVELDEFVQDYDGPGQSRAVLEARATLQAPRGGDPLARHNVTERQRAGADAASGVTALAVATSRLGADLAAWLGRVAVESPGVAARCRGA